MEKKQDHYEQAVRPLNSGDSVEARSDRGDAGGVLAESLEVSGGRRGGASGGAERGNGATNAQLLIDLVAESELWHTPNGGAYITAPMDGHSETWRLHSAECRTWLNGLFYKKHGQPLGKHALDKALDVLEAKACHDGDERGVFLRVTEAEGAIYLDLTDPEWRQVRITSNGWEVVRDSPVRFQRSGSMKPLPEPVAGGSIDLLRGFVNVADEDWPLLLAWMVAALRPSGPYPILLLQGEQGSAKSTTTRVLRSLIDPSAAPVRSAPTSERDLMISATNAWLLAFDNLSGISNSMSDALCRLSTGGGFSTRKLYADDQEVVFAAQRPLIMNGIEELAGRDDLRDRAIILQLPEISPHERCDQSSFWKEFDAVRPQILGALLNAVSTALRNLPHVHLWERPRMADFAFWATAAEPALELESGALMRAYECNRREAIAVSVENNSVAREVIQLARREREWEGTATALLQVLEQRTASDVRRQSDWPRSPASLSGKLKRLAPALRASGVEVRHERSSDRERRRLIQIRMAQASEVPSPRLGRGRLDDDLAA